MLTYQIRPRVLRLKSKEQLVFPADCTLVFHFQPPQPFGLEAAGGRTAVRDVAASVVFNANSGEHTIESKQPLSALDVRIEQPNRTITMKGNTLTITQRLENVALMNAMIESVYHGLPTLLNVSFADAPYIERVEGTVGSSGFRWELATWWMSFANTTQKLQESRVATAFERMGILSASHRRRLIAALHYFHVACRLSRAGRIAGEFVAEVVLNLAKMLEALFPPSGDGRTRDAVRKGLKTLGYSEIEAETDFMPAMVLRDAIDVAHVGLGLFTVDQLGTIHTYTERAEHIFRGVLERILTRIESGDFDVAPYTPRSVDSEVAQIIERLDESPSRETPPRPC